jgi:hypothetical protein
MGLEWRGRSCALPSFNNLQYTSIFQHSKKPSFLHSLTIHKPPQWSPPEIKPRTLPTAKRLKLLHCSFHAQTHNKQVTDSTAPQIDEGAGAIASDFLAAESTREGGKFGDNRNSEPQGVAGANSTFANTNTSGATQLDPAPDAEARSPDSGPYPSSLGGQAKDLAVENTSGSSDTALGGTSSDCVAPSYINSQFLDGGRPKGKNLTEGGFDSDDRKNASFTSEIGSKDDPGRLAEEKFVRENADAADAAGMPRLQGGSGGSGGSSDNTYGVLDGETSP